ncbi:hypothetical protein PVAND_006194 [Polypedilum vanderplanki]|uniref:lysozyme n=1 Tax=Polypedilum vanderplanki TaxID=319348 RepID=A0A9J6C3A3_POLVA|nr:hypothetical protein PVAND_006194 [Polypedilum vanderplanki]
MKFLFLISFILIFLQVNAKIYTKCELAKKLDGTFARNKLPDWMCLVKHESSYNSRTKGPKNKNGSYDWGIFQINDKYWCRDGSAGGDCNIDCNRFINDDITDDITCAKKIFNRHGFEAWYGWKNNCKGKSLDNYSINECF